MARKTSFWVTMPYRILITIFILYHFRNAIQALFEGSSQYLLVRKVAREHNEEFRHPYYTVCPIKNVSTVSNSTEKLVKLSQTLNVPDLFPEKYSKIWLKTFSNPKDLRSIILTSCLTVQLNNVSITPGSQNGKVKNNCIRNI